MPALSDFGLRLTIDDVIVCWRARGDKVVPKRIRELLATLLVHIEAENLIQPRVSFRVWPVESRETGWLELGGGIRISSPKLNHHLPGARFVATGVCTIGCALERQVSERFASGDRLPAVMLDEIGTVALFRVSDRLENEIQVEAARLGLEAGGVLNPGEDGLEISQQRPIVELANGPSIGISSSAAMLVPRKSISMLIGIGARMPTWTRGQRCAVCAARDRCPHRRSQIVGARS